MVPGDKIPDPWPSLSIGLQAAEKRFRRHTTKTKRLAEEIESAFHEAAHAVVANELGGDFGSLEIHRTAKERAANNGAFGSIGLRFEDDLWGDAVASVAGPIAGCMLTGVLRKGSDYGIARDSLQQDGRSMEDAEVRAHALVQEHWYKIERIASLLMITDFGGPNGKRYAYWHLRQHMKGMRGVASASESLSAVPDAVKDIWAAELERTQAPAHRWQGDSRTRVRVIPEQACGLPT